LVCSHRMSSQYTTMRLFKTIKTRKILVYLLLFVESQVFAQMPLEKEIDQLLHHRFGNNQAGMAVMVIKNGKILYKKGVGLADVVKSEPITPQSNFRMASVSKQFTAMGIMLLVKQGDVSYEDNLLRFFPTFDKRIGEKITIRHLLTHSSGIWDYENLVPDERTTQVLDAEVVTLLSKETRTYFEAGTQFKYSNSGFCLLEQIVEKASGMPYVDFITKHIFVPLGMSSTRMYEAGKPIPHRAMGFAKNKEGKLVDSDQSTTSATKGDGCVYTSLDDYYKWYNSLVNNKLISIGEELKKVHRKLPAVSQGNYGLGWFFQENNEEPLTLYHTGSSCGFSNGVLIVPGRRYLFLYFSNISNNHAIEKELVEIVKKHKAYDTKFDFLKMVNLTN